MGDYISRRSAARAALDMSTTQSKQMPGTLNSEQLLNWTLHFHSIRPFRLPRLPFCLLVKRKCRCCLLVESCAQSGNKCRPCLAEEETAQQRDPSLEVEPKWPSNAMQRYDAVVPTTYAALRESVTRRGASGQDCLADMTRLARQSTTAATLDVHEVCRLALTSNSNCTFDPQAGRWGGAGCAHSMVTQVTSSRL